MKKKTKRIIIWTIVLALVLSLAGVCYWQRNNIKAAYYAFFLTEEKRAELEKENNEIMQSIIDKFSAEGISALPEEAVQMIYEGTLTEEDAVNIITGKVSLEEVKTGQKPQENQSSENPNQNPNIAALVAKIYILRGDFVGRLDALVSQGYAEYKAGTTSKKALAGKYISLGSALEGQCDAQMESILSQIEAELKKSGGDLSLVSQIRAAYRSEKAAKKASIMSLIN
ncbi:MAG: hypothetical protein IJO50_03910 [Clostridia bacterium]|nr:hypothetical protein [Clostridia bacterium]